MWFLTVSLQIKMSKYARFAIGICTSLASPLFPFVFSLLVVIAWISLSCFDDFYRAMPCISGTSHGPVSLSVRLSQVGVLLKRLNVGSQKQHHTIAQELSFSDAKHLREIRPGSPPTRAPNACGVGQNRRLSTNNRLCLENGTR